MPSRRSCLGFYQMCHTYSAVPYIFSQETDTFSLLLPHKFFLRVSHCKEKVLLEGNILKGYQWRTEKAVV